MRNEIDVLKDFEALGYKVKVNNGSMLYLTTDCDVTIHINKIMKAFRKFFDNEETNYIFIKEYKLLNELFTIWNWM